ncbi:hypothetical protein MNQ95_06570 [Pseudoxanthomonas daejeonensis]|uniref:Transmembrane protein n=1 Tax=Pseudoxanthomonas daejeonensis TaxID=266062 RepID=A0ABQ6ZBY9_9GAMM|nr:hypothetical protein [Pseudoxanthomonas daejeonensis]KAF1697560.1 hypothetical protein CSC65_01500 [Pseudoxanthomonas daejeonensis]UNK58743.1 hypothetical protein MNQ95_06570 [Pseudoxanthomonas daejeonensis]
MHWLYLLLAFGALLLAITTVHDWLLGLFLLAAVGLFVAWIRGWYLDRLGGRQQDEMAMIDPVELRRLRELAEARKREAASPQPQDPAPPAA